jgi:oligopeptide/dipeptide ABC transporter ATP-binding protein
MLCCHLINRTLMLKEAQFESNLPCRLINLLNPPQGCRFHTRYPIIDRCSQEQPEFREVKFGHWVACWLAS